MMYLGNMISQAKPNNNFWIYVKLIIVETEKIIYNLILKWDQFIFDQFFGHLTNNKAAFYESTEYLATYIPTSHY
jgi:hypothetical protein